MKKLSTLKNRILNKMQDCLTYLIILNIILIFTYSFLCTRQIITQFHFFIGLMPLLLVNSIICTIMVIKKRLYKNIIYILIGIIAICGIISTIFAINKIVSLIGFNERYEGLLTILYYFSLMVLCSFISHKNKNKIVFSIIFTGLIQCIYAIFQVYDVPYIAKAIKINSNYTAISIWATGFLGNPNFFGSYMLICVSYAIGLYADETNTNNALFYITLICFFSYGLLISNTMSCVVRFCIC